MNTKHPPEKKETPAYEAKQHSKRFLVQALRKKSTGGTTQGSGIAGAGSNSGAGSAAG